MEKLIIRGGNRLEGTVTLSGAKNSALKVLCASILTSEKVKIFNMPTKMEDVKVQIDMLKSIGAKVEIKGDMVFIDNSTINRWDVSIDEGRNVRTSLLMLGSLLGRFRKARVPLPGGCNIGERKYDLHIYALERLGAKVNETSDGYIEADCCGLKGAEVEFPNRTIGGTENAILAACLAKGKTIIKNATIRPEVLDLVNFLNSMGAKIDVPGAGYIKIEG
ncbi:MAG TPA: UDP-N-acetylglucosamine 1-carboxyvinyltransferase, partial [candidate division WOR-3 bacterium]|nr:UDP-N-acetylglucosamine 1-carboxyvinyltransferase [candidate division WOR-3 bacterium]